MSFYSTLQPSRTARRKQRKKGRKAAHDPQDSTNAREGAPKRVALQLRVSAYFVKRSSDKGERIAAVHKCRLQASARLLTAQATRWTAPRRPASVALSTANALPPRRRLMLAACFDATNLRRRSRAGTCRQRQGRTKSMLECCTQRVGRRCCPCRRVQRPQVHASPCNGCCTLPGCAVPSSVGISTRNCSVFYNLPRGTNSFFSPNFAPLAAARKQVSECARGQTRGSF